MMLSFPTNVMSRLWAQLSFGAMTQPFCHDQWSAQHYLAIASPRGFEFTASLQHIAECGVDILPSGSLVSCDVFERVECPDELDRLIHPQRWVLGFFAPTAPATRHRDFFALGRFAFELGDEGLRPTTWSAGGQGFYVSYSLRTPELDSARLEEVERRLARRLSSSGFKFVPSLYIPIPELSGLDVDWRSQSPGDVSWGLEQLSRLLAQSGF